MENEERDATGDLTGARVWLVEGGARASCCA